MRSMIESHIGELSMPDSHIWHPGGTTGDKESVGLRFCVLTAREGAVSLEFAVERD